MGGMREKIVLKWLYKYHFSLIFLQVFSFFGPSFIFIWIWTLSSENYLLFNLV